MIRTSIRSTTGLFQRVPLFEDEDALSLLSRLALRYHNSSLKAFGRRVGLNMDAPLTGETVGLIATLAGAEAVQLIRFTPIPSSSGSLQFLGHTISKSEWLSATPRRCSLCIRDDAYRVSLSPPWTCYHRPWWDYKPLDLCPVHSTPLLDACPSCGICFSKDFTNLRECSCGFDLSSFQPKDGSTRNSRADEYIFARLLSVPHSNGGLLDEMPLASAITALRKIGQAAMTLFGSRLEDLNSHERSVFQKTVAFDVFTEWPRNFEKLLEALHRVHQLRSPRPGTAHIYGGIYGWLQATDDKSYEKLRAHLESHFLEHVAINQFDIFGKPTDQSRWLSFSALNAKAGLHSGARELYPTIRQLGLSGSVVSHRMKIPRSAVTEILELHQDRLSLRKAAFLLGTPVATVWHFVKIGTIRLARGSHPYLVRRSDVMRLLDSILSNIVCTRYFFKRPKSAVTLKGAAVKARQPIGAILGSLAAGLLKPIGHLRGVDGFDGLLFDLSDVDAAFATGGAPSSS